MKKLIARSLLFALVLAFLCCSIVSAQVNSELDSINNAASAIDQAFNNVLEAETIGANVTTLITMLNTAGHFLAQAQNFYSSGNNSDVVENAQSAYSIANQVNIQALSMQKSAADQAHNNIIQTVALSSVGAIVFILILFLIWRRVKSSYLKRLLDLRIEGAAGGT